MKGTLSRKNRALAAARCPSLNLSRLSRYREIGNGHVFGFTRPMRDDGGITRFLGQVHGLQCLCQTADLVDLDENRVGDSGIDASLESISVRDKQVIAYQLDLFSQRLGDHPPSFPVVLCEAILDGDNRILVHPTFI